MFDPVLANHSELRVGKQSERQMISTLVFTGRFRTVFTDGDYADAELFQITFHHIEALQLSATVRSPASAEKLQQDAPARKLVAVKGAAIRSLS